MAVPTRAVRDANGVARREIANGSNDDDASIRARGEIGSVVARDRLASAGSVVARLRHRLPLALPRLSVMVRAVEEGNERAARGFVLGGAGVALEVKRTAVHGGERPAEPSPRVPRIDESLPRHRVLREPLERVARVGPKLDGARVDVRAAQEGVESIRGPPRGGVVEGFGVEEAMVGREGGFGTRGGVDGDVCGEGDVADGERARGSRALGGVDDEASDVGAERVARGEHARGWDSEDDRAGGDGTEGDEAATDGAAPPDADVRMHLAAPCRAKASRERRPRLALFLFGGSGGARPHGGQLDVGGGAVSRGKRLSLALGGHGQGAARRGRGTGG